MNANELHYKIWDGVVDWIKLNSGWLKDNTGDITAIKREVIEGLDITLDEKELLERHSCCVLCTCSLKCTDCPLCDKYNCGCTSLMSPYEECRHCIEDDGDTDASIALAAAKLVRDVPLPEGYNRRLLDIYEEIIGV